MTNKQKEDWFLRLDPNGLRICSLKSLVVKLTIDVRPYSRAGGSHPISTILRDGDQCGAPVSSEVRRQEG